MKKIKQETLKKIRECKALQGKTMQDVLETQEFKDALKGYMMQQKQLRLASYRAVGYKRLKAHVIDRFIEAGLMDDVDGFTMLFAHVINKACKAPRKEREYVEQLGKQAYNLAIKKILVKEMPELEDELFGIKKGA